MRVVVSISVANRKLLLADFCVAVLDLESFFWWRRSLLTLSQGMLLLVTDPFESDHSGARSMPSM